MGTHKQELPRLQTFYQTEVLPRLLREHAYHNTLQVPRVVKVTLNMGVGAVDDKKVIKLAQQELSAIAGQHAVITVARKSIAGFKIREGWPIGVNVTLRARRMYEFLDRLLSIALPRTRDFRGLDPRAFDGRGNYNMGIKEHIVFPEILYDKIESIRGLDMAVTTTAGTNAEAYSLLKALGFPFREQRGHKDDQAQGAERTEGATHGQ